MILSFPFPCSYVVSIHTPIPILTIDFICVHFPRDSHCHRDSYFMDISSLVPLSHQTKSFDSLENAVDNDALPLKAAWRDAIANLNSSWTFGTPTKVPRRPAKRQNAAFTEEGKYEGPIFSGFWTKVHKVLVSQFLATCLSVSTLRTLLQKPTNGLIWYTVALFHVMLTF